MFGKVLNTPLVKVKTSEELSVYPSVSVVDCKYFWLTGKTSNILVSGFLSGLSTDRNLGSKIFSRILVMQRRILIPAKHLRWSLLRKKLEAGRFLTKDFFLQIISTKIREQTGLMC